MPESADLSTGNQVGLMGTHRLEAFCDGVIAIAITLLVLEIKVPTLTDATAASLSQSLMQLWPLLLATVLSFVAIGCYWVNQHRFLRALKGVNHGFILTTLLWLLALCLLPFPTAVLGETMLHGDSIRVAAPLYLFGLAFACACWSLSWWYACTYRLLRAEVTAKQRCKQSWQFVLALGAHLVWFAMAFWWPWLALAMGTLQILLFLAPQRPLAVLTT